MKHNFVFARSRVARAIRNSTVATLAMIAACGATDALTPGVSESATESISRLAGATLFINPESPARVQADAWRRTRPADAAMMDRIWSQPVAQWIGDWNTDVRADVAEGLAAASSHGAMAVFVAYNIPHRDCGLYSAGGSADANGYREWIREFAAGLAGKAAVVVLEPDAVPAADCLSASARDERFALLRDAIQVLKAANAVVYLDAGNARWLTPDQIAERLTAAGIGSADGFSLNVSNYLSTASNLTYGEAVSKLVGGRHFVIDASRNGVGGTANDEWCNPPGQALGASPTTETGHALADAFLWIKMPGESDGTCNGGPRAGEWWGEYALGLAQRQPISSH
jgi:endoglucanase